jgi:hypothetical protein
VSERQRALKLSARLDRLLSGEDVEPVRETGSAELDVARRLVQRVERLPPVPPALERRVRDRVRTAGPAARCAPRQSPRFRSRWQPALWSALGTAAVLVVLWLALPGLGPSGETSVWAHMRAVLLGQTRVELTPTLEAAASPVREPLRDLVAAELLIGRAPSLPKTLPEAYTLQEVAAISYPDLPAWISQPLCVELCYGDAETPCALRLRQYRLLFRDFGGISGVRVASGAVRDVKEVDLQGVTAMHFTLARDGDPQAPPLQTLVWERDGLLLELESEYVGPEQLLEIARSTR